MAKAKEPSHEKGTTHKGPRFVSLEVKSPDGEVWGVVQAEYKEFKTGSLGYYANGKVTDPNNPDNRYQIGCNIILIGSKKD